MPLRSRLTTLFIGLMLVGAALIAVAVISPADEPPPATAAVASRPPVVAVPDAAVATAAAATPTAAPAATAAPNATPTMPATAVASPTGTPTPTPVPASPTPAPTSSPAPPPADAIVPGLRERFGVIGGNRFLTMAAQAGLPAGTFMNWRVDPTQPIWSEIRFWHMVRLGPGDGVRSSWTDIDRVLAEQPGAIWVVGNEPDVVVQDNLTPQVYARLYHDVYTYIKSRDPTALVAVGGVAQPTPLRLAYLDQVLDSYRQVHGVAMPVDIWTVHAFILREEAGGWGVGIPPGMSSAGARLYEVSDHGRLPIFQQHIVAFRAWMAAHGYQDRPLAVTEYGILMPHDYGYPPESVAAFMTASFDFMLSAANETGYPADGSRLVQWWVWFSLYEREEGYGTGNLVDPATGQLTPLGQTFAAYVSALR